jgi:hypothetical protein
VNKWLEDRINLEIKQMKLVKNEKGNNMTSKEKVLTLSSEQLILLYVLVGKQVKDTAQTGISKLIQLPVLDLYSTLCGHFDEAILNCSEEFRTLVGFVEQKPEEQPKV